MIYRWEVDNTVVGNPKGWDTLVTVIERQRDIKALLKKQDGTFEFSNDGFDLIYNRFTIDTFDTTLSVRVYQSQNESDFKEIIVGTFILSDIEFDLKRKTAKCKLYDNSYQAKISGNKSVGAFLYASRSKLNKTIDPIVPVQLQFFKPSDGTYYSRKPDFHGATIRVYDALRFLIDFMTDKAVNFESDTFGPSGQYYNYFITTGRILELVDDTQPDWINVDLTQWETYWEKVSFATLFSEIDKRFNVGFSILPTGFPTLKIEVDANLSNDTIIYSDKEVDELKLKTLTELLYNKIMFGQGETDDDQAWSFPEQISGVGFKQEEFQTILNAPFDKSLDLKTNWITSSNVIERLLVDGLANSRDNDRKIFIIEGEADGVDFRAKRLNPFTGSAPFFYNQSLTNLEIVRRFFGAIPASIATHLNTNDYSFKAVSSSSSNVFSDARDNLAAQFDITDGPLMFDDDYNSGYDDGNNYGNGTAQGTPVTAANSLYTIPVGGVFSFLARRNIFVTNFRQYQRIPAPQVFHDNVYIYLSIEHYDSSNTFINRINGNPIKLTSIVDYTPLPNFYPITGINSPQTVSPIATGTFNCNTGDYLIVTQNIRYVPIVPNSTNNYITIQAEYNGEFSSSKTLTGGGVYETFDPKDISILAIESKSVITEAEFDLILANPSGSIELGRFQEQIFVGNIESLKFPHEKGEASILLNGTQRKNR